MKITSSKTKVEFTVEASYRANLYFTNPDLDTKIIKLARKYKGYRTGAGMGFGYRDNGFAFRVEANRDKFVKALAKDKSLKVTKCFLSVYVDD